MIDQHSVLAVVVARGGSKGLPGKNLRRIGERSLVGWAAKAALESRYVDRAILSSDDAAIREEGARAGLEVPFERPPHLATDEAKSVDVALHALDEAGPCSLLVLLQPTSPLRTSADIDACLERCAALDAPACVTVCRGKALEWMYRVEADRLEPVVSEPAASRRQDARAVFVLNGAVYVVRSEVLRAERTFLPRGTAAVEMPAERSVDVDTEADFVVATALASRSGL
jgi:CMP-N,N'-diacetyllegionaminic acid synthase